jgi:hypothetical protein
MVGCLGSNTQQRSVDLGRLQHLDNSGSTSTSCLDEDTSAMVVIWTPWFESGRDNCQPGTSLDDGPNVAARRSPPCERGTHQIVTRPQIIYNLQDVSCFLQKPPPAAADSIACHPPPQPTLGSTTPLTSTTILPSKKSAPHNHMALESMQLLTMRHRAPPGATGVGQAHVLLCCVQYKHRAAWAQVRTKQPNMAAHTPIK